MHDRRGPSKRSLAAVHVIEPVNLLPVFAAVVLGGIGSAYGALAGGLVLGLAMELSTWPSLFGGVDPVYKPVVAFAILAAALMMRPQGLFGRARVV